MDFGKLLAMETVRLPNLNALSSCVSQIWIFLNCHLRIMYFARSSVYRMQKSTTDFYRNLMSDMVFLFVLSLMCKLEEAPVALRHKILLGFI